MRTVLFGIDLQSSFINTVPADQQQVLHDGELCVGGALEDAVRLTKLIDKAGRKINTIVATMDSHPEWHIAHTRWYTNKGRNPDPFTILENVNGEIIGSDGEKYMTTIPGLQEWTLYYLKTLKDLGRYPHCLWPDHCLIGTKGHSIVPNVRQAFNTWCNKNHSNVMYVTKGSSPKTEHFGVVKAEVEDPGDFTTKLNTDLINYLMNHDQVLLCGQAKSHCVKFSCTDIVALNPDFAKKVILLEDCSSSVTGFEQQGEDFVKDMRALGMQTAKSTDF